MPFYSMENITLAQGSDLLSAYRDILFSLTRQSMARPGNAQPFSNRQIPTLTAETLDNERHPCWESNKGLSYPRLWSLPEASIGIPLIPSLDPEILLRSIALTNPRSEKGHITKVRCERSDTAGGRVHRPVNSPFPCRPH